MTMKGKLDDFTIQGNSISFSGWYVDDIETNKLNDEPYYFSTQDLSLMVEGIIGGYGYWGAVEIFHKNNKTYLRAMNKYIDLIFVKKD